MKFADFNIEKGDIVIVLSGDLKKELGEGTFVGTTKSGIPKIRLKKKIIYGYECWWRPKKEVEKDLANLKRNKK